MANPALFLSSLQFILPILASLKAEVYNITLICVPVLVFSLLNHGTTSALWKWTDRSWAVFSLVYIVFQALELQDTSALFLCVLLSIFYVAAKIFRVILLHVAFHCCATALAMSIISSTASKRVFWMKSTITIRDQSTLHNRGNTCERTGVNSLRHEKHSKLYFVLASTAKYRYVC